MKSFRVFSFFCALGVLYAASLEASLSGRIMMDGSSTVFPLSEAVAEEARQSAELRRVRVGVSFSGTGGGFQKFCNGEVDIVGASRPIAASELEACQARSLDFIELPVAFDGLAVVVHPSNTCAEDLSLAELKRIWEPAAEGKITNWKQVRSSCPDMPLTLFAPGTDSGTFDYFTEAVVGRAKIQRSDFQASEDDNVLAMGVARTEGAMGYFGYAYYEQNPDRVKLVAIDSGAGPVKPSLKSIAEGSYSPLSRPLFIYVSRASAQRPEVAAFVSFYLQSAAGLAKEVGYAPLGANEAENASLYSRLKEIFEARKLGSSFASQGSSPMSVSDWIQRKN